MKILVHLSRTYLEVWFSRLARNSALLFPKHLLNKSKQARQYASFPKLVKYMYVCTYIYIYRLLVNKEHDSKTRSVLTRSQKQTIVFIR